MVTTQSHKINWPLAHDTWDNKERDAMHEVIASGKFTFGEKVKSLKMSFAITLNFLTLFRSIVVVVLIY